MTPEYDVAGCGWITPARRSVVPAVAVGFKGSVRAWRGTQPANMEGGRSDRGGYVGIGGGSQGRVRRWRWVEAILSHSRITSSPKCSYVSSFFLTYTNYIWF